MTTGQKWGLFVIVIAAILVIVFWKDIANAWNKAFGSTTPPPPTPAPTPKDGDTCNLNGVYGTIINGTCVPNSSAERTIIDNNNNNNNPNNNNRTRSGLENIVNGNSQSVQNNFNTQSTRFMNNLVNGNNSDSIIARATPRPLPAVNNPNIVNAPNGCDTALGWCAHEYGQTGNTNGFYCKVWKGACAGGTL